MNAHTARRRRAHPAHLLPIPDPYRHRGRTGVQLKDKWRNLIKFQHLRRGEAESAPYKGGARGAARARDGGGGANATDDAETEKTRDERVGKPPASDPPAVLAAIDLTADDDDDVPMSGKDEPEPGPEPERTRAFDERTNVARKGEAHDDRLEPGAAKEPSTDLQQMSGAVPNRATSDGAPRATNEERPSVSVAAPSPALEQQVMEFFKRRRDERLAHTPEADPEPQGTPEERPGTRARTEDAEDAAAKTAKPDSPDSPDSPERVLPARVPDEAGGDPLAVSERAVSEKTEKNLDDPRYHRAPPGYFEPGRSSKLVRATTRFADAGIADFEPSLLRAMPGAWAYAAIGPEATLAEACDAFPKGRPVQFVKRMRNAHGRWGLALETRAGCVRLCTHDPARPGRPTKLWFPLEALRALPADFKRSAEDGKDFSRTHHVVRLLSDVSLVTRLCDTLPSESPVRFVRAIGYRCGSVGALAESRGAIVKVRFEASYATLAEEEKRRLSAEASEALKRPFTTWLPVECVAIVTPWE